MTETANNLRFIVTGKSRISRDAPSAKGFAWILAKLLKGEDISDRMELRHEGRCGACGRKLTTPESIDTGIGPVCAGRMGIPHGKGEASAFDGLRFLTAGNATVTATSARTGISFTYKVVRAKGTDETRPYFVKVLTGSNNESDYSYLGTIFAGERTSRPAPAPVRDACHEAEQEVRAQEDALIAAEAAQAAPALLGHAADGGETSRYCRCREGDTVACDKCQEYRSWKARSARRRRTTQRRTACSA